MVAAALLGVGVSTAPKAKAANLYWDAANGATAGLGGTGNWNTTSAFWSSTAAGTDAAAIASFTANDIAYFTGTAGEVTLGGATTIGGLVFTGADFTLTGSTLTLAAPVGSTTPSVSVSAGNRATVSSVVAGSAGLTKTGDGSLLLTNTGNTFTGDVTIKGGSLVVTSNAQLGLGTGQISIFGWSNTGNPGYSGGSLVVKGAEAAGATGITIARDVTFSGRGPTSNNNSGGLISIGYNTFTGTIGVGSATTDARAWSAYGTTTLAGNVLIGATGQNTIFHGNGNWTISGLVGGAESAQDRFIKTGNLISTTLWLKNSGNTFAQSLRIDNGTVRVQADGALGANITTTAIDLNNGTLEIRSDALAGFATRNLSFRDNASGTLFVDHDVTGSLGIGSAAMNQTISFPSLVRGAGTSGIATLTIQSRNGYNTTVTGNIAIAATHGTTLTNSSSGLFTYLGNLGLSSDATARALTIQGGGDSILTGNITGTGALHEFTKGGSGTLTLSKAQGTGTISTFTGNTKISDGTLQIRTIDALNPSAGTTVVFNNGALEFLGNTTTGAGETWTNKTLNFDSGNAYLYASQSGSAPTALILPNNFAVKHTATGGRTLFLGGSSTQVNEIRGLITNGISVTSVTKIGSGTWQISAPTSYGSAATLSLGATGTTATATLTLAAGTTSGLVVGQPIAGAGIPFGSTITAILDSTNLIISKDRVASTAAASATAGLASGATSAITTSAVSAGTGPNPVITAASTTALNGLVAGQSVTSTNLPAAGKWYVRDITSGTSTSTATFTLASANGSTILAGAVLSGEVITPVASTNFGGTLTIQNGTFQASAGAASSDIINDISGLTFATDSVTLLGNAGGTFNYVGWASGQSTEVMGRLTPAAGHGIIKITNGTGADTLTFLDLGSRGAGATLDLQPGIGTIGFTTAPGGSNGILGGYATYNGVNFATPAGGEYTAATTLVANPGGLTNYVLTTGTLNFAAAGQTLNSLKIVGTSGITTVGLNGILTVTSGGILFDNSGGTVGTPFKGLISGGTQLGANNSEVIVTTNGTGDATSNLTISSLISSGTGSLTKAGTGTLVLSGANVYTGNTTINQGTVQLSGATAAPGASSSTTNVTTLRQGATLDINAAGTGTALYTGGTSYPLVTIGALLGTGTITNSGGGTAARATISLGGSFNPGSSSTFGGLLQDGAGILNVVINGTTARVQGIVGAQTYTGATVINTGVLAVTSLADGGVASGIGASSSSAGNLIFNAGTLVYTGAGAAVAGLNSAIYLTTQTPSVSTDRLFSLAGNATILSRGTYGNESAAAGTGNNNASLVFSNTGDLAFLTSTAKTLTLGGTSIGDNIFVPRITNNTVDSTATSVTVSGGLWILNPAVANTYTGATSVTGGQLRAVDGVGIPTNSPISLWNGVLEVGGASFTRALAASVVGAGTVSLAGATGFAAGTTSRLVVSLAVGATPNAALTWATTAGFAPTSLVLGSSTALGETEITNNIALGTAPRSVTVNNNGNTDHQQHRPRHRGSHDHRQ